MKEIKTPEVITKLRKQKKITQEQLANELNVSPQAVSKWETGASLPDVQTLPLIAEYFGVSVDYLFYGESITYDEIYDSIFNKVAQNPQMSKESYEEAFNIFGGAHHGISKGNIRGKDRKIYDEPSHISNENGISLLSGKGYGTILTRSFFESIDRHAADFAAKLFSALSSSSGLTVCMAIISMSDISFGELQEKISFSEDELRQTLDELIKADIVVEKRSKHKSLGLTYEISSMYHTCLCVLIATAQMQKDSLNGISCCMAYGDYPINL